MASGNLERLLKAGVVQSEDRLSPEERLVIDGLSEDEIQTLIGIRAKLAKAMGDDSYSPEGGDSEAASFESSVGPIQSNFIV